MKIGIAILTLQAEKHLPHLLPPLLKSPSIPRILIVDSESTDKTVEIAKQFSVEVHSVSRHTFNHGLTREKARQLIQSDIVVMMTQDAYPRDETLIGHLTRPLIEKKASCSYARQLPHLGAGPFESYLRHFNYPSTSHIRSLKDHPTYGIYTFFNSNSCAAYSNDALDEIGGFSSVLLGEDTVACAKLLRRGHSIAYVAEAEVFHSHAFTLRQEFKRHFDIGYSRKCFQDLLALPERDTKQGRAYAAKLLRHLSTNAPHLFPYGLLHIGSKYLGYQIGTHSPFPNWLNKRLSSQPYYFS